MAAEKPFKEGDPLPFFVFKAPQKRKDLKYLGLAAGTTGFLASDIKAEVVVFEFFNQRCRHCQREAPNVNRLFDLVREKGLERRIKFLGIGAYNSQFEVDLFKRRYQVPFPLIPDRKLEAFKALGAQGTPQFFVILIRKKPVIAMIVSGFLPEPPDALEEIMRKSGLKTD